MKVVNNKKEEDVYKPLAYYNDASLSQEDMGLVEQYKSMYSTAQKSGDTAGMNAAHLAAENLRKNYGYSGGTDGSNYIQQQLQAQNTPEYKSIYGSEISSLLDSIVNSKFSYNVDSDPLYGSYASKYNALGNEARENTIADMAQLTGGYGSSAAVTAASMAQNNYGRQLADVIPQLEQAAYNKYLNQLSLQQNVLSMYNNLDQQNYGRWSDEQNFNYGVQQDKLSQANWQQNFNYGVQADKQNQSNWQQNFDYGVENDNQNQTNWEKEYNQNQTNWDKEFNYNADQDKKAWDYKISEEDETLKADDNVVRRIKSELDPRSTPEQVAYKAFENANTEAEYYALCEALGLSKSAADKAYLSQEKKLKNQTSSKVDIDQIFQMMMNDADPMKWLELNKTSLTLEEYKELKKLLED